MKYLLFFGLFASSSLLWAVGEKKYTEEEFQKKLSEEVRAKVDEIKKKSVADLTKEILDKEEKLRLQELELQKRRDALKVSEEDLGKKYAKFETQQREFIGCLDKNQQEAQGRVGQLVEMIANMKPQKAAEVLSIQDTDIAVRILHSLDSKKSSKIFNFMEKEVSAKLQKQLMLMKR